MNSRPKTRVSNALKSFGVVAFVISSFEASRSGSLDSEAWSGGMVDALRNLEADIALGVWRHGRERCSKDAAAPLMADLDMAKGTERVKREHGEE